MRRVIKGAVLAGAVGMGMGAMDHWYPYSPTVTLRPDGFPDTYWAATCEEPAVERSPLTGRVTTRVCVVGGGLAGLNTALSLAEKGVEVTVLEQGLIGAAASGMSKGLAVGGVQVEHDAVARMAGEDVANAIDTLTEEASERLASRVNKYSIKCRPVTGGCVTVSAFDPPHEQGEEFRSADWVREHIGTSSYRWGEYDDAAWGVDPLALTRGLARAGESLGVRIFETTPAVRLERGEGGWKIATPNGTVEAEHVVLCGSAHLSPSLSRRLFAATVPVVTWMVATEPLGERCPLKEGAPMVCDDFVALNYWRRSPDGRILFGGLADCFPLSQKTAERRVRESLAMVYPSLRDVRFDYTWGGVLSFGWKGVPLIGREGPDGPWYATGFGGHGIVPTCMAGTLLSDAITEGDEKWKIMASAFPPEYCGWPWSRAGATCFITLITYMDRLKQRGWWIPDVISRPW